MRYRYHNLAYLRSGAVHGKYCNPVMNELGKCVVGKGTQVVVFEDGIRATVIRRCLRVRGAMERWKGAPVFGEAK